MEPHPGPPVGPHAQNCQKRGSLNLPPEGLRRGVEFASVGDSPSGPDEGENRSNQVSRAQVPHMLWSVNVQGTANLFRAIALVEEERPTVVVFQEPDFCPRQQGQVRGRHHGRWRHRMRVAGTEVAWWWQSNPAFAHTCFTNLLVQGGTSSHCPLSIV